MKAAILTRDKLSFDVFKHCLMKRGFHVKPFETLGSTTTELEKGAGDYLVFVDLDYQEAYDTLLRLPLDVRAIAFGAADAKKKARGFLEANFILKPFSQERINDCVDRTILTDITLKTTTLDPLARVPSAIEKLWAQLTFDIWRERERVSSLLKATPEQLQAMLAPILKSGTEGAAITKETLPLRSVLIATDDQATYQVTTRLLAKKCVLMAEICRTGKEAWKKITSDECDAVILDWDLENPTGLAFYCRLRASPQFRYIPVVVVSGQINQKDFRLLDEDFAVTLVEKPLHEAALVEGLDKVTAAALVASKFLDRLTDVVHSAAKVGIPLLSPAGNADDIALQAYKLAGDRFLESNDLIEAENAYATAWQLGDRRLSLVTGYAKACFLGGKSEQAHRLLLNADALAPKSVERLCLIGELDLTMQKPEDARRHFEEALEIDPGAQKAKAGLFVAETILQNPNPDPFPRRQLSSYLNMVGIGLSREKKTALALRYYKSAMVFVREKDQQAKLWFNVGLCHLRGQQQADAKKAFETALDLSDGTLTKAQKYFSRGDLDDMDDLFEKF